MDPLNISRRELLHRSAGAAGMMAATGSGLFAASASAARANAAPPLGDLAQRLGRYGPFPPTRRHIVVFSTGCDWEDHGPAMAPSSDTHFATAFSAGAAVRTGVRYLGNAPYTSDPVGDCALNWLPLYISEREYFDRTARYCAVMLDALEPRPEGVLIHVPWHGMNIMEQQIDEFARRLRVRKARLIPDIVVTAAWSLEEKDYRDSPHAALARRGVGQKIFQHAGFFDYCVAEALGHLDRAKLDEARRELEADQEKALRKYPGLHNLAGYVRYGGKELDPLRAFIKYKPGDPFPVDPKWQNSCPIVGQAIVRRTIELAETFIIGFERELFGEQTPGKL